MKLTLALVLCGATCCLALPRCLDEDMLKCAKIGRPDRNASDPPQTEEDLDDYCRSIMCMNEFYNRCGDMNDPFIKAMFNQNEKIYGSLCFKKRPLRKKYLDNVMCLQNAVKNIGDECRLDGTDMDHETFCKKLPENMECVSKIVAEKCNEDAREVYEAIYPGADFHGCGKKECD